MQSEQRNLQYIQVSNETNQHAKCPNKTEINLVENELLLIKSCTGAELSQKTTAKNSSSSSHARWQGREGCAWSFSWAVASRVSRRAKASKVAVAAAAVAEEAGVAVAAAAMLLF